MNIEPGMMPPEPSSEDKMLADIHNSWEEASDLLRRLKDERECIVDEMKYYKFLDFDLKNKVIDRYNKKIRDAEWEVANLAQRVTSLGGTL